jgi:hypothetical protein
MATSHLNRVLTGIFARGIPLRQPQQFPSRWISSFSSRHQMTKSRKVKKERAVPAPVRPDLSHFRRCSNQGTAAGLGCVAAAFEPTADVTGPPGTRRHDLGLPSAADGHARDPEPVVPRRTTRTREAYFTWPSPSTRSAASCSGFKEPGPSLQRSPYSLFLFLFDFHLSRHTATRTFRRALPPKPQAQDPETRPLRTPTTRRQTHLTQQTKKTPVQITQGPWVP